LREPTEFEGAHFPGDSNSIPNWALKPRFSEIACQFNKIAADSALISWILLPVAINYGGRAQVAP
jgi:hypothetical protein